MKILHRLYQWGIPYLLVGSMLVALYWEEQMTLKPSAHKVLAVMILITFGCLLIRWVGNSSTLLLASQSDECEEEDEYVCIRHEQNSSNLEKII